MSALLRMPRLHAAALARAVVARPVSAPAWSVSARAALLRAYSTSSPSPLSSSASSTAAAAPAGSSAASSLNADRALRARVEQEMATGTLQTSHVIGALDPPLYDYTTGRFMHELAQKFPRHTAIVSVHQNNMRLSYAALHRVSSVLAVNIARQLGVRRGDRVAVCAGNLWEYPALQVALGKIGAVLVPLNPAFTDTQFHAALNSSGARALIIQSRLSRGARKTARDITGLIRAATDGNILPAVERVVLLDSFSEPGPEGSEEATLDVDGDQIRRFGDLLAWDDARGSPHDAPEVRHILSPETDAPFADEIINMQFTSGTTGMPKISCLTHRNVVNNGRLIGERLNLSADQARHPSGQDFLCAPVPMFHCFGLVLTNMACLSQGAAIVYASEAFDARRTLQAVRQEQCTGLQGVPTMFAAEMELHDELEAGGHELLAKGICAGSSVPIEIMRRVISTLNLDQLTICYGMTETSPVSFMTTPADTIERRCETVGSIMPHTEARIIKSAPTDAAAHTLDLAPVPVGARGEIIISGYLLQKWYHDAPAQTAEAMVTDAATGKRWMRTGDEGELDAHGYLRVTGRIKDLIIRGGENIHPLEIENVLFQHPAVSQASVVGVPDAHYGEAVAAFVVLHEEFHAHHAKAKDAPTADALREFVKEKLGHYMSPKYVFYVPDFPKTASGKIRKVDLKGTAATLVEQGHGV